MTQATAWPHFYVLNLALVVSSVACNEATMSGATPRASGTSHSTVGGADGGETSNDQDEDLVNGEAEADATDAAGTGGEEGEAGDESAADDPGTEIHTETFEIGGSVSRDVPADFLIVMDNSSSMKPYLARVLEGFKAARDAFGPEARVGAMTGMIGTDEDLAVPHAGIKQYPGIAQEPGFLNLIDASSIASFVASDAPPQVRQQFPLKGCAGGWFAPDGVNDDGEDCLAAALQIGATGVGCEPNLYAVMQLMRKHAGAMFFRPGAFVHVIFVSDEAHPGCVNPELTSACPQPGELEAAISGNTPVSGVRFHGAVRVTPGPPYAPCSYLRSITESGGAWVNIADPEAIDYSSLIQRIAASSAPEEAVRILEHKALGIVSIVIDGAPYTGAFALVEGRVLKITSLDLSSVRSVQITYQLDWR